MRSIGSPRTLLVLMSAVALCTTAALLVRSARAEAATISVSTTAGLVAAVASGSSGDVIQLAPGTYSPGDPLEIARALTIQGPTSGPPAILAGNQLGPGDVPDTIRITAGKTATIRNVQFQAADQDGAAISVFGTLTLESSTLTGNNGYGIWVQIGGAATIRNATIADNGNRGIATANNSVTTIVNATIAANAQGGLSNPAGAVHVTHTIIAGNSGSIGDCSTPVTTSTSSLSTNPACGVDIVGDPRLGALTTIGSSTSYRPLLATPSVSPAINAGAGGNCPSTDQRGVVRSDGACDIGAYEYADTVPPTIVGVPPNATITATSPTGASHSWIAPTATDDISGPVSVSCAPPAGTRFPVGTTTVTCSAADGAGNASMVTFTVTVRGYPPGIACRADGAISGRGSTFTGAAYRILARGYRDDVCGPVVTGSPLTFDGNTMLAYNYASSATVPLLGSGAGRVAAQCRTDAFGASDGPYSSSQLVSLNGAVPLATSALCTSLQTFLSSPFQPKPAPWPDATGATVDTQASLLSFPITGAAVAVLAHLPATASCPSPPVTLRLTVTMVSRLYGGDILNWRDSRLRAVDPDTGLPLNEGLATCNVPVVRVVRQDDAGTTQILKNYLGNADPTRTSGGSSTCEAVSAAAWSALETGANNLVWPGDDIGQPPPAGTCSTLARGASAGAAAQLAACQASPGRICFAGLADAQVAVASEPGIRMADLRNATNTSFRSPGEGTKSACDFGSLTLPGFDTGGAVGLDPTDSWASDNASGNRGDATYVGNAWPICGLSWVLVYSGLGETSDAASDPVNRLNSNQRRTLYTFFSYVLSSTAQERLDGEYYASLPPSWVTILRVGFQTAFGY